MQEEFLEQGVRKMGTVIGLFPCRQEVNNEISQLEDAGFTRDNICVSKNVGSIKKLLKCEPNRVVAKYALWGAFIGTALYGIFSLVAVWCECNLYPLSQTIAFEIVVAGVLVGALIGGIIGGFTGLAEYETDTHLYIQGIIVGDKVFVLHVEGDEEEKAIRTLRQIGCLGIRVLHQSKESI